MKIFTSALVTETNTFSEHPTTLASFEELGIIRGPTPARALGDVGPIVEQWRLRARRYGDEVVEGVYAIAQPAGRVRAEAYAQLRGEILNAARAAMPLDMVLLLSLIHI